MWSWLEIQCTTFDIQHSKFESWAGSRYDIWISIWLEIRHSRFDIWISSWFEVRHSTFEYSTFEYSTFDIQARDSTFDIQNLNLKLARQSTLRFSYFFFIFWILSWLDRHTTFDIQILFLYFLYILNLEQASTFRFSYIFFKHVFWIARDSTFIFSYVFFIVWIAGYIRHSTFDFQIFLYFRYIIYESQMTGGQHQSFQSIRMSNLGASSRFKCRMSYLEPNSHS